MQYARVCRRHRQLTLVRALHGTQREHRITDVFLCTNLLKRVLPLTSTLAFEPELDSKPTVRQSVRTKISSAMAVSP